MSTIEQSPPIHVLMARILGELPAIGKDRVNTQQNFKFRGIDDVMNALNPLLAKHGVFYVPDVVERIDSERATKSGGVMYVVNLHVRYRFYGPNGDHIEASGWGEGTDSGDKATNKAMTGAMKYVLFQAFAISTEEAAENDADGDSPEATSGGRPAQHAPLAEQTVPSSVAEKLTARINALPDEAKKACKKEFAEQFGKPTELKRGQSEAAEALVAGYEVAAADPPDGKGVREDAAQATTVNRGAGGSNEPPGSPIDPDESRRLHIVAGDMAKTLGHLNSKGNGDSKFADTVLDAIVYAVSNHRTQSTKELTAAEGKQVRAYLDALIDGVGTAEVTAAAVIVDTPLGKQRFRRGEDGSLSLLQGVAS